MLVFFSSGTPSVLAQAKEFTLPSGPVSLTVDSGAIEVFFRNLRYHLPAREWNMEIVLENRSFRDVAGPIVVSISSEQAIVEVVESDGRDSLGIPFILLEEELDNGLLNSGERSKPHTLRVQAGDRAIPELTATVFYRGLERGYGLGVVQSLDGQGQILPSVQVTESKLGGESRVLESDDRFGWLTVGSGEGTYLWKFEKTGYLPVWRVANLEAENVVSLENPKLLRQSQETFRLSPLNGASHVTSDGRISVSFPRGAFSDLGEGRLTPMSSQTLPAPLPLGWSPRQAAWVELGLASSEFGELSLEPWEALSAGQNAILVGWREASMEWEVKGVSPGGGSSALVFPLLTDGAYAVVQADRGAVLPVVPEVGGILGSAVGLSVDLENITAVGEVSPGVVAASTDPQLVTAFAKVTFQQPSEALRSGMRFICEVSEVYRFTDGSSRRTPVYECSLTAFQTPVDGPIGSLQALFPMRPQLLIGADELVEATVTVDVKLLEPFAGNVIGPDGGRLALDNGIRFEALPGRFDTFEAIRLSALDRDDFAHFETEGMKVMSAFELSMGQSKSGRGLSLIEIPRSGAEQLVLARVVSRSGVYGLEPVERFSAGEGTRPLSLEGIVGSRLSGIDRSGQYVLLTVSKRQSLVSGTTTNAGGIAQGGMHVQLGPWSTLSEPTGFYRLLSPVGSALLRVLDATTGDIAVASVEIVEAESTIELQTTARGPIVVGVDPAADSERVPTIAAITITFSESVNPMTVLNGGVDLVDFNDLAVPVSLSLNSRGNELTLFPVNPLTPGALYRTRLQRSIADSTGLGLDGEAEFRFTTALPPTRGIGGQLIIYQPGAQALQEEVERNLVGYDPEINPFVIAIHGTQGASDPEVPVIVTNESTGATSTVLSKVDGSFFGFIDGTEDDFVSATYVNQNGSRVYLPVSRQEFEDGFVGLYQQGGILEAESDGGAVQVLVEPGSINDKSKLRLQTVDLLKLLNLLKGVQPEGGGQVLGGMVLSVDGDETPDTRAEISFEINPESLPLDPGVAPEDATWGLAIPRDYDGVTTYEIIDSMEYVDGKLVTQGLIPSVDSVGSVTGLRRLRNGTVTPGGIVSEQLRPPISIGVLFDAISLAQKGSKRVNALDLSAEVLNGLGLPGIGEVITHQLLLPIMMTQGTSVGIGGIVKAINVDDNGAIDQNDPGDPLTGALIMVDQGPITRRPGKLRPGIMFVSSNQKGEYAFNVPVTLDASSFILTATHPRYPFQIANGGATIGSLADRFGFGNFANVPLFFGKGSSFDVGPSGDTIKPLIRAAHDPVLPTPGDSSEAEGVVLTVVGIDNGTMATIGVVAKKVINLSSGVEENLETVTIEEISEGGGANSGAATTQANSLTKRFRIKSQKRA
ncbi:Ig-like domain-containing protein, partial [bacterium]|nr:Ig-like domain-containing protein [bacterium]